MRCTESDLRAVVCRIVPHIGLVKNSIRLIDGVEEAALSLFLGQGVANQSDIDTIKEALLEWQENKVFYFA